MFIVGIDIAKRNHAVKIITSEGESVCKAFSICNNCTGYNQLLERFRKLTICKSEFIIAMESTSHYWLPLYTRLRKDGYTVVVLNPIQTYAMRDMLIRDTKTDHIDALLIAEVIRFGRYSTSNVPQEKLLALRELCRNRFYLKDLASDLKRKLIALLDQVFPEFETAFESSLCKSALAVLRKYPTPEKLAKAQPNKLTEILRAASNSHFGEWKAQQLKELAKAKIREDLEVIQRRYTWFLDEFYKGVVFEKKKGQRKYPLAEQIKKQFLEPYISGVSLGESSEVDAPQINLQYAMLRVESHEPEIVEKMYFDRLIDFVYAEFMKGVQRGFIPKRCGNCGKWFLQTPGASYSYCENIAPGEENVTCREIGAKRSFRDRVKNDEIWQIHQRAYKKYFARIRRGTITKAEFEEWSRQAEQLRDEALKKYEKSWNDEQKATIIEQLQKGLNQK